MLAAAMPTACGSARPAASTTARANPTHTEASPADSLASVKRVTYLAAGGRRVSALLATPNAVSTRGCLVLEDSSASSAEGSGRLGQTAAELGLATLSLEASGENGQPTWLARALREPRQTGARVREALGELRGGVRYLDAQRYCRQNVAAVGVGLYGVVVTLLAATDSQVRAAVVVDAPASWLSPPACAAAQILSPLDPERWIGRVAPRPVMVVSTRNDPSVPLASGLALQAAARNPKTTVTVDGGQDPTRGSAAEGNDQAIGSFLLRNLVEPTYEVSGNPNGTYLLP
jgi:fermentation-respiration switch protein FrsA (DUF1100 family)